MSCIRARVLGSYRSLLKAGHIAFESDYQTFDEYRIAVRKEFHFQAEETEPEIVEKLIKRAHQVALEVRTQIVPIQRVDETKYKVSFDERHFEGQKWCCLGLW